MIQRDPIEALEEKTRQLRIINDLAMDLLRVSDMDGILWTIAKTAMANLNFEDCVVYLLDESRRNLVQRAAHGPKNPQAQEILDPIVIPLGEGIVGSVAATGRAEIVSDTTSDPRYIVDDDPRLSEIAVPIICDKRVIGVIDSEHAEKDFYTRDHLELLVTIASITSTKIASAMLVEQLRNTVKRLKATQESLEQSKDQVTFYATHDPLTGLRNRREFERLVSKTMFQDASSATRPILCYIDLDQFKLINDRCGHVAGDALLRRIPALFGHDSADGGNVTVGRIGGDEFALLYENTPLPDVVKKCQMLLDKISNYLFRYDDEKFGIGISIGIVQLDHRISTVREAFHVADTACYIAKRAGRHRLHVFTQNDQTLSDEAKWASIILSAIDTNQLHLYAQPIVATKDRSVRYYEVLLRLQHQGRVVEASEFIPAIERYAAIGTIDRWVIEQAVNTTRNLTDELRFFVNISGSTLNDESFVAYVRGLFKRTGYSPKNIGFEITETSAIANLVHADNTVNSLKNLGCSIALDDFGSGFASYEYLRRLPVDIAKFDGNCVKGVDSEIDYLFLGNMNDIAHRLGIETVAESIESEKIWRLISGMGVDFGQGYHLGRPVPIESLIARCEGRESELKALAV